MEDQKLDSLAILPEKWTPKYQIKRIEEDPIIISLQERNIILDFMGKGQRFIFVQDHILMLNSIKSIDPLWKDNVPPRPKKISEFEEGDGIMLEKVLNQEELDEWDRFFRK